MEDSILISTKSILGLDEGYDVFDLDIMTHINAAFSTLYQLGVGPTPAFMIDGDQDLWSTVGLSVHSLSMVKSYIFLKTRMVFDPPGTSFLIEATNKQIQELEGRLSVFREFELPEVIV